MRKTKHRKTKDKTGQKWLSSLRPTDLDSLDKLKSKGADAESEKKNLDQMRVDIETAVGVGATQEDIRAMFCVVLKTKQYGERTGGFSMAYKGKNYCPTRLRPCTRKGCSMVEQQDLEFLECPKCKTVYCSEDCILRDTSEDNGPHFRYCK